MSPLDPRAKELWHNVQALMFMDFWQAKNKQEDLRDLARMLGVLWTREDVEVYNRQHPESIATQPRDELRIPLACIIEPSIVDVVKQFFGKSGGIDAPEWAMRGEMIELGSASKEDFLKFVRGFVSPKIT